MINRLKGVMLLLPLIAIVIFGGLPLYITSAILSSLGLREIYSSFQNKNIKPLYCIGYIFVLGLLVLNITKTPIQLFYILCFILFIYLALTVILLKRNIVDIAATIFGITYIAIPFQLIVLTHQLNPVNSNIVWLIFIISFSTDIFAYVLGNILGKNKLIPSVSPNKTVEGSLGGIIGAVLVTLLYGLIFNLPIQILLPITIIGSILAQIGDLFASSIKRYTGLKDFGNIIPGHGGIIDRFDSILFVAPVIYSLTFFIK